MLYYIYSILVAIQHLFTKTIQSKFSPDGAGWLLLQQIIIAPMSLFTTVLLARVLSVENYGFYKYILSMYGVISLLSCTGFMGVAGLNIQRGKDKFFAIGFAYKKLLRWAPSLVALSISFYYFYHQNFLLGSLFFVTVFSHFFVETYSFYSAGFFGKGAFKISAIFEIINYFVSFFPPLLVGILFRNDENVLILFFVTMFFSQFVFRFFAYHYVRRRFGFTTYESIRGRNYLDTDEEKAFRKEGLSLSFNSFLSGAGNNLPAIIVFNRLGVTDTAIYSLAVTFADFATTFIASTLNRSVFILSGMSKTNTSREKFLYIRSLYKKYFLYALFVMAATVFLLPFVYKYLFAKYFFSYTYALVYSISILAVAFSPAYQYFLENRQFHILNYIQILVLGIHILGLFAAAHFFGIWGAIVMSVSIKFIQNLIYVVVLEIDHAN